MISSRIEISTPSNPDILKLLANMESSDILRELEVKLQIKIS
jgi:hypothetical protein